jgi:hypothetical protein
VRKKIGIAVVLVLVLLFVLHVNRQESHFSVHRAIRIAAAPGTIYPLVSDFRQWSRWSSWDKDEPDEKRTFLGPPATVGSRFLWSGGLWIGAGTITIIDAQPDQSIKMSLKFRRPWRSTIYLEFKLQPSGDATTELDWIMSGDHTFRAKALHLFMSVDKSVGPVFEPSLANIKALAEAEQKTPATASTPMVGR